MVAGISYICSKRISIFVACKFQKRNWNFFFGGGVCVKKNPRVRDPVPIAGESTVLGVIILIQF